MQTVPYTVGCHQITNVMKFDYLNYWISSSLVSGRISDVDQNERLHLAMFFHWEKCTRFCRKDGTFNWRQKILYLSYGTDKQIRRQILLWFYSRYKLFRIPWGIRLKRSGFWPWGSSVIDNIPESFVIRFYQARRFNLDYLLASHQIQLQIKVPRFLICWIVNFHPINERLKRALSPERHLLGATSTKY